MQLVACASVIVRNSLQELLKSRVIELRLQLVQHGIELALKDAFAGFQPPTVGVAAFEPPCGSAPILSPTT